MAMSRASMQQQLKGNKMAIVNKKENDVLSRLRYIEKQMANPKTTPKELKVLKMREKNLMEMLADDQFTFKGGGQIKKKPKKKNVGGFLETFSPVYSVAKGRGPISDALSALGPVAGLSGIAARQQQKKRKKKEAGSDAMKATGMTGADRMSGGGKIVRSKRTRSIDGIATKGKTRGTQR